MDRRLANLLPVERWPTAAEAARGRWFTPARLGPLTLEQRTWVPAMVPWRATDQGFVTDEVVAWYRRFAQGRPGGLVIEATGIRDVKSGPLLRAGDDRFVPGLRRLVDAVKEASGGHTRLFIQLIDFLAIKRRPAKDVYFLRHLELTAAHRAQRPGASDEAVRAHLLGLPEEELDRVLSPRELESYRHGLREKVTDTHLPHIAELPRVLPGLFAAAASRCAEAGFDGVELHFAHAYTMASFLSPLNTRSDGYGGSPEARLRLPLEVYRAVRAVLPRERALGCRFLADEIIEGGGRPSDAAFTAVGLARAGIDFLSLSRGGKFEDARVPKVGHTAYPYTGPSGHECMPTPRIGGLGPWGRNLEATRFVRQAVRAAGLETPVVACGGISSFAQAEDALESGAADVVASARQSLADPDWFLKVREGRGAEVRRCFFTNYCEGLDQAHDVVTCQRWDRLQGLPDDATVPRAPDGRRLVAP
ncbi:MAG: NADH:flavin oxidoreductase [Myxococcaceae bacterium]|nr:NADH:flavin oxidoreductase [Myxococcaceae bacterium]